MSLQDMTADEVIASIHNALEQELQKHHPTSPSYHSGHVALSYRMGARDERERIIKVAKEWISGYRGHDGECDCLAKAQVLENFINHDDFKGEQK